MTSYYSDNDRPPVILKDGHDTPRGSSPASGSTDLKSGKEVEKEEGLCKEQPEKSQDTTLLSPQTDCENGETSDLELKAFKSE